MDFYTKGRLYYGMELTKSCHYFCTVRLLLCCLLAFSYAFSSPTFIAGNGDKADSATAAIKNSPDNVVFQNNLDGASSKVSTPNVAFDISQLDKVVTSSGGGVSRQQRVHSLRNILQSTSHVSNAKSCGSKLMKEARILLVRVLSTWVHMDTKEMACEIEADLLVNAEWMEVLASEILSQTGREDGLKSDGAFFEDAKCLARVAVNTLKLLLLDDTNNPASLSTLFNCSHRHMQSDTVKVDIGKLHSGASSRITALVDVSFKTTMPWHQNVRFSIVEKLSHAQHRVLQRTAPDWHAEAMACFNENDTNHEHHESNRHHKHDSGTIFDSAAVDAFLYLSLGYVPDVKCPSTGDKQSSGNVKHAHDHSSFDLGHDDHNGTDDHDHDVDLTPEDFTTSLQNLLQVNETVLLTPTDFELMLDALKIGSVHQGEGTVFPAEHGSVTMKSVRHEDSSDEHDHEHEEKEHGHGDRHGHGDGHGHEHAKPKKPSIFALRSSTAVDNATHCFSSKELMGIYGFSEDQHLSYENVSVMFPALIQQQLSSACMSQPVNVAEKLQPTVSQRFGLGTLAVFIISLVSMIFLLIIPSTKRQNYRYIMSALIALSASTMLGDALLHLLPQALAIHADHGSEGHADIDVVQVEDFVLKQLVALAAIYGFYLFEMLISGRHHAKQGHGADGHGHSHIPDLSQIKEAKAHADDHNNDHHHHDDENQGHHIQENGEEEASNGNPPVVVFKTSDSVLDLENVASPSGDSQENVFHLEANSQPKDWLAHPSQSSLASIIPHESTSTITRSSVNTIDIDGRTLKKAKKDHSGRVESYTHGCWGFIKNLAHECVPKKSLGWMVIMGDAVHNLIDGIAIGAAFSEDLVSGLSTSIAIACHEIPHEVGDFAALLTAGLTWRAALFWNVIHTFLAFVGLYIGLGIATEVTTRQWVFALTAGMFIYVSLTEMMPELTKVTSNFWKYFIWQNVGLLFGFGLMLIIAIFEDQMAVAIAASYNS